MSSPFVGEDVHFFQDFVNIIISFCQTSFRNDTKVIRFLCYIDSYSVAHVGFDIRGQDLAVELRVYSILGAMLLHLSRNKILFVFT